MKLVLWFVMNTSIFELVDHKSKTLAISLRLNVDTNKHLVAIPGHNLYQIKTIKRRQLKTFCTHLNAHIAKQLCLDSITEKILLST